MADATTVHSLTHHHIRQVPSLAAWAVVVHEVVVPGGDMQVGAEGAVELIATALALKHGIVPPTINYKEADPECDLNYVPNKAVEVDITFGASNSLGFGGHNACVVLKKI